MEEARTLQECRLKLVALADSVDAVIEAATGIDKNRWLSREGARVANDLRKCANNLRNEYVVDGNFSDEYWIAIGYSGLRDLFRTGPENALAVRETT